MNKRAIKQAVSSVLGRGEIQEVVATCVWMVGEYLNPRPVLGRPKTTDIRMSIPDKTAPRAERQRYAKLLRVRGGSPEESRLTDWEFNARLVGKFRGKGRPTNRNRDFFLDSLAGYLEKRGVFGHHAKALRIAEATIQGEPLPRSPADLRKLRKSLARKNVAAHRP